MTQQYIVSIFSMGFHLYPRMCESQSTFIHSHSRKISRSSKFCFFFMILRNEFLFCPGKNIAYTISDYDRSRLKIFFFFPSHPPSSSKSPSEKKTIKESRRIENMFRPNHRGKQTRIIPSFSKEIRTIDFVCSLIFPVPNLK